MKHLDNNSEKKDLKIKKNNKKEKESKQNVVIESELELDNKSSKDDNYIKVELDVDTDFSKKKNGSSINGFLNKKTDFKVYELILFAVLIMIVSVFLTVVVMHDVSSNKNYNKNKLSSNDSSLEEFEEVYNLINSSYYIDINNKTLIEGAINGMLGSLNDPHTSYFNKSETDSFN